MQSLPRSIRSLALLLIAASCTQDRLTAPTTTKRPQLARSLSTKVGAKIPGQYIVRLRDGEPNVQQTASSIAAGAGGKVRRVYTRAIKGFSIQIPDVAAAALAKHPAVLRVEQNAVVNAIADQSGATWGLDRIDQHDLPLNTDYVYNATGDGVDAYIIDTGIRTSHNEFGGRAVGGVDEVFDGYGTDDCYGHGTHVAGIVGGTTYGVAKNVRLISVRVLDCSGSGTWEGVLAGIDWVTSDHQAGKPAVANMSLSGYALQIVNDAITNSINTGIVYAVSASNDYGDACNYSPASTPAAITVGATDAGDTEADFSNRGSCVDIWAPGVAVTSAMNYDDSATETLSGTSMSSPHVAGAAALYLQGHPTATAADVDAALKANATTGKIVWNDPYGSKPAPSSGQDYLLYTAFISAPMPNAPAAPSSLAATAPSFNEVDLTWADNSSNENAFRIERCQDAGTACTTFVVVAAVGANQQSYSDYAVSGSSTYRYRIVAYNSGGTSEYSNVATATTPAPPPPPNAPSALVVNAAPYDHVELSWQDNSSDEWYFLIERCQDAGSPCSNFQPLYSTSGSSIQDYYVSPSSTYRYRVYAVGLGGNSGYSNIAVATTAPPPPPPLAPTSVTAIAVSISQVNITWQDNSSDEYGFTVQRCMGAGCTTFADVGSLPANSITFSDNFLSSNTTYRYRVAVFNQWGTSYSQPAQVTTLNQPPIATLTWSCKNGQCSFDGRGSWDPDGAVSSWAWTFGDGTSGSGATTSHTYKMKSGTYNVTLTVTDNMGGKATVASCTVDASNGRTRAGSC